jgi:hypothetical protein
VQGGAVAARRRLAYAEAHARRDRRENGIRERRAMFIGHFGVGFGAKALAPQLSLGTLFLAAQFLDLLWPSLLLFGVERVDIVPGATTVTPLAFTHYPVSHSLLAVTGWALLLSGVHYALRRDRRGALLVGLLVVSHWLLDALVHRPDLPLVPGGELLVGLGLWNSLPATLIVEVPLFALGALAYARTTVAVDASGRWGFRGLILFLGLVYAANLLGPPPPDAVAIAWAGQLQWLLVLWAYWIDRHRRARRAAAGRS